MEMRPDAYVTRHSIKPTKDKPESTEFKGITEAGVELAEGRAEEIAQLVDAAEPGTIVFQAGVSFEARTRSTMQVYGDVLKKKFEGRDDVIVIDTNDVSESTKGIGFSKTASEVVRMAEQSPDAKMVIDLPLQLKEMMAGKWFDRKGKAGAYTEHLLAGGGSLFDMEKRWFTEQGVVNGEQLGPIPNEVAESLLKGFQRLRSFAEKFFPNRPIVVGCVGHSFELDALLAYLAGNGNVDTAAYEQLQSGIINETEMIKVSLKGNDVVAEYRGQELRKGE